MTIKLIKLSLNEYCDDWGEQLVGKSKSVLVVYDLKSNEFKVVDDSVLPKDYFAAQVLIF
jgi:hypothetical protein